MDERKFVSYFYKGESEYFKNFMYLWDDEDFKRNYNIVQKLFPEDTSFLDINNPEILYNIILISDKILNFYGWNVHIYPDAFNQKTITDLSRLKVVKIIFDDEKKKEMSLKINKPLLWDIGSKNYQPQFLLIKKILRFLNNIGLTDRAEIFFLAMCKSRNQNVDWATFSSWLQEISFIPQNLYNEIRNNITNLRK